MALNAYITALQNLLHDQAGLAYTQSVLTGFINEARQQVALEGECIKGIGTANTVPGQTLYQNNTVTAPAVPLGIANLITPRSIQFNTGAVLTSGANPQTPLIKRSWDWFNFYELGMAARPLGPPRVWCPFQIGTPTLPQGGSSPGTLPTGSFYINPPNAVYVLQVDGTWGPQNLASDNDPEAIPGPFNDAVPLYGLYLAFLDARLTQLATDALQTFELTMVRARGIVTPLPEQQAFPGGLGARRPPGMAPVQRGAGSGPPPTGGGGGGGA